MNKTSTNTSNVLEYLLKPQDTGSRREIGQLHMYIAFEMSWNTSENVDLHILDYYRSDSYAS